MVRDGGDVEMFSGDVERALADLEPVVHAVAAAGAIPLVLGGDHTIALPDATGVARHHGSGKVSMLHFDAHADTGDIEFGSLYGHGAADAPADRVRCAARRQVPADRAARLLAGSGDDGLDGRAADALLRDDRDRRPRPRRLPHRVVRHRAWTTASASSSPSTSTSPTPAHAPGTGTPEPGGLTSRQLLDAVRRICLELPVVGMDVVEVSPPYDHADITALLASRVVLEALSGIAARRRGLTHDPAGPLLEGR